MEGETARDAQVGFRPREETLNQPLAAVREEVGGGAMGRRRRGYGQKPARQRHGIKSAAAADRTESGGEDIEKLEVGRGSLHQ